MFSDECLEEIKKIGKMELCSTPKLVFFKLDMENLNIILN